MWDDGPIEVNAVEHTDAEGTGACGQCGSQCLDPNFDGIGITVDGEPVCKRCADSY